MRKQNLTSEKEREKTQNKHYFRSVLFLIRNHLINSSFLFEKMNIARSYTKPFQERIHTRIQASNMNFLSMTYYEIQSQYNPETYPIHRSYI
ncbi:hypothetical protein LEP1GSC062_0207 [Leptospira alexanderi serovar Manhao 3 str. L 60]|uniref:Uncharacterized protein n=1 Tax=Leptospira alexanderi serovar Manhao 3 str. L 60 TaxID=1049759 RepID=V6HSL7_9LEPT|nr:hypothetical protein LEP1GSC062_0207 [Leptospira alexanderi serovar Manhao 3 str. L 60]